MRIPEPVKRIPVKKGIYILPSLFTLGNLACGFMSVINSINGNFNTAAWMIMLAIAFDVIDGRVARLTNTTSRFGMELDSLCDLISFGMAPAILMYLLVLSQMLNYKAGVGIALFFVIASALRLAKFNLQTQTSDAENENSEQNADAFKRFSGLPTPAAAGLMASFVLSWEIFYGNVVLDFNTIPYLMEKMPFFFNAMPLLMVLISFLMLSNVPYSVVKKFKFSRPKTMQLLVLVVALLMVVIVFPQNMFFIIFLTYALSGIVLMVRRYLRMIYAFGKKRRQKGIDNE
ncbi:MAG: CDP-diacylglycerol--serine O-phosphatidyltransferase [Elusimicrobia bacterium]|nr:CDP-diacylglycerol--serine O-phosphatidyltransferase [Elusimicrobiota bacterium]